MPGSRYEAPTRNLLPGSEVSVCRPSDRDQPPSGFRAASPPDTGYPGTPERTRAMERSPDANGLAPRNPTRSAAGPRETSTQRPSLARNRTPRPIGSYSPTVSSAAESALTPATKGTASRRNGTIPLDKDAFTGKSTAVDCTAKNASALPPSGPVRTIREGAHPAAARARRNRATIQRACRPLTSLRAPQ